MSPGQSHWTASAGRALLAGMGLLGLELSVGLLLANGSLSAGLLLHAAACAVAAWLAFRRQVAPTPAVAALQMTALLLAFLGPVAAAAGVVTLAVITFRHDPVASAALWHEHLFPNLAADALSEKTDAINRHQNDTEQAGEIESFYDVLQWGALAEKEHVLSMISRSFRPEFAPVLRAGMAVDDIGLRAQAAAGLSLLEARTSARLADLQEEFRQSTGDDRSRIGLMVAQALADAAHSGLYDDVRTQDMRAEIVSILSPLAGLPGADPLIPPMLGRTLIQLGQLDNAVEMLTEAADTPDGASALTWLLEAMFRQGDFDRLAAILKHHSNQVRALLQQDGALAPALRFWGSAE